MYKIDVFRGKHLAEGKVAEFTVYLRKEGRITVPREVRAALAIKEGNLVKCKIEKLGTK
jgi:bifunctional DNA-binding transcriptional regulator/antitoxin component of YhaV-PrlF toxin-antitoxin module